jgi:hypothetical protein
MFAAPNGERDLRREAGETPALPASFGNERIKRTAPSR